MSVHYRAVGGAIIVFGNTYPHRDRIKALGGRYNGPDKTWRFPYSDQALAQIDGLCKGLGGGQLGAPAAPAGPAGATVTVIEEALQVEVAVDANVDAVTRLPERPAGLTVRQLVDQAAVVLSQAFPSAVWVVGELQNCGRRTGAVYLDLAEGRDGGHQSATTTVRAVIWRQTLTELERRHGREALDAVLQDGMQVRCLCRVQLYRERGALSLTIEDLDPAYTKGALALARERLLKELRQKGLDQAQKRLALTPFPFVVGLVSAEGSRAYSDFVDQLQTGGFPGTVLFSPAPMQGDGVPELVCKAIERLCKAGVDLIVVTRGGGSAADLRWFDASEVAYAIARCPVPIVAAIGHHDDHSVAEEVAHAREKTPTAAAEFVLGHFQATRERIERAAQAVAQALDRRLEQVAHLQAALAERLAAQAQASLARRAETLATRGRELERAFEQRTARLALALTHRAGDLAAAATRRFGRDDLLLTQRAADLAAAATARFVRCESEVLRVKGRLETTAEARLGRETARLEWLCGRVQSRDPSPWLTRGWTQLTGPRGPVRSAGDVRAGDRVTARLADALIELAVDKITPRDGPPSAPPSSEEKPS